MAAPLANSQGVAPLALAVLGNYVYWAEHNATTGVAAIKMVPRGGGPVTRIASSPTWGFYNGIRSLAVDDSGVYWTVASSLPQTSMVMKLSGPVDNPAALSGQQPVVLASGLRNPIGVALDAGFAYWIESDPSGSGGAVGRVAKNGGSTITLVGGLGELSGIAVDDTSVYFGSWNGEVSKVPIAGGTTTGLGGFMASQFLAIDATSVYFAAGDSIGRVSKGGGCGRTLASGLTQPWGVVVDQTGVYWTECPTCFPGSGAVRATRF